MPYTTLRVDRIEGGAALNIVPGKCTVDLEIRNISRDDETALLDRLAEGAKGQQMRLHMLFPSITPARPAWSRRWSQTPVLDDLDDGKHHDHDDEDYD